MKLLFDTHLLIWAAEVGVGATGPLPDEAAALIDDPANELWFSVASLWEMVIKRACKHPDFTIEARIIRRGLLDNGWEELPVDGAHAFAVATLPALHKDPFDRLLIAQTSVEGATLLTSDAQVADYPGPIRKV